MAGRPRSFDRDAALELALEAFWRQGYEATSISQLTSAMGIAAPSLYAAFGGKDQLFREALSRYMERIEQATAEAMDVPDVREAILRALRGSAACEADPSHPQGCFVMSEPSLGAERAASRALFATRIRQGVDDGQLPADTNVDGLAEYVLMVLSGLSARARDGATEDELHLAVDLAMAGWPGSG